MCFCCSSFRQCAAMSCYDDRTLLHFLVFHGKHNGVKRAAIATLQHRTMCHQSFLSRLRATLCMFRSRIRVIASVQDMQPGFGNFLSIPTISQPFSFNRWELIFEELLEARISDMSKESIPNVPCKRSCSKQKLSAATHDWMRL